MKSVIMLGGEVLVNNQDQRTYQDEKSFEASIRIVCETQCASAIMPDKHANENINEEESERETDAEGTHIKVVDAPMSDIATMDVRTVVQMMQDMKMEMNASLKTELKKFKEDLMTSGTMQHECQATTDLRFLKAKIEVCEYKERLMVDAMSRMTNQINEMQHKLEMIDSNNAKRMMLLSGFECSTKKADRLHELEYFVSQNMDINIRIEEAYPIGGNTPRDIVITLLSINDKHLIFQNISKIKNLKNSHGRKYYFRDYLTAKQNEHRKRAQHVADVVGEMDPIDQEEVSRTQEHIYIGDRPYQKIVTEPEATSVLRLPLTKLNQIMATPVDRCSKAIEIQGNRFTAYSIATNDKEYVQNAYMKIRLNHAEVRHIVCVWNIPGPREYENIDGCDDQDVGASAPLVEIMKDSNISNRAIYIVRNCGQKLYADRTSSYIQAMTQTMKEFPVNSFNGERQQITQSPSVPILNNTQRKLPNSYANAVKSPPPPGTNYS